MKVWNKIKGFLVRFVTVNVGLKIIACIMAFVLWILFAAVEDPVTTHTYTIPLNVINLEDYEASGGFVSLKDGSSLNGIELNVTVRAPKSTISVLSTEGASQAISASVDVFDIENDILTIFYAISEDYQGKIEFNSISNVSFLEVATDARSSLVLPIRLAVEGVPAEGFLVPTEDNRRVVSAQTVTVSGPSSVLNSLDHVSATVSVESVSTTKVGSVPLVFYDKNNREVVLPNNLCQLSCRSLTATIPVYRIYHLPVELQLVGNPQEGYLYNEDARLSQSEIPVYVDSTETNAPDKLVLQQDLSVVQGVFTIERDLATLIRQNFDNLYLYGEGGTLTVSLSCTQE